LGGFSNCYGHPSQIAIVCLSQNHYLYLEIHRNLVGGWRPGDPFPVLISFNSRLIDINGDGLPDRVFDVNPSDNQPGLYVFLNTGNGFDSGKQWQSNLGGDDNWKNRPMYQNGEYSMLIDI
jgi:hypothetical protein